MGSQDRWLRAVFVGLDGGVTYTTAWFKVSGWEVDIRTSHKGEIGWIEEVDSCGFVTAHSTEGFPRDTRNMTYGSLHVELAPSAEDCLAVRDNLLALSEKWRG